MPCRSALEIDLEAYLADPTDPQWTEIREHFPHCAECRAVLEASAEFEEAVALAAGAGAHPEPRELLAYRHDVLDPPTRAGVEQHLEGCASCRDELAAVAVFATSAERTAGGRRSWTDVVRERLRAWTSIPTPIRVAVGALGAVLIAAALWMRLASPPGTPLGGGDVAELPRALPPSTRAEVPQTARPGPSRSDRAPVEVATAHRVPAAEAEGADPAVDVPDRDPAPGPSGPSVPGRSPAEPRSASVPERVAAEPAAPPERAPEPPPESQPEAEPEPIFVAMVMPEYAPAADADPRRRPRGILRATDSGRVEVRALAPAHVARTSRARPELYWHLSAWPPAAGELQLAVSDPQSGALLVEAALPAPAGPGRQRVDPADLGADLPVGRELRWSVALVRPGSAAPVTFGTGWIRRVPADAELQERLAGQQPGAVPAIYAGSGLWYDALASAIALERVRPDDPEVTRAVRLLLEQAGLDELTD